MPAASILSLSNLRIPADSTLIETARRLDERVTYAYTPAEASSITFSITLCRSRVPYLSTWSAASYAAFLRLQKTLELGQRIGPRQQRPHRPHGPQTLQRRLRRAL